MSAYWISVWMCRMPGYTIYQISR